MTTFTTPIATATANELVFISQDDKLVTDSLHVAQCFGKLHKNVIQKLENLDCSKEFTSANFSAHEEIIQAGAVKRASKVYQMTKDGFMFLVMGFTGKKAAAIKEAYINAFNTMAERLANTRDRKSRTDERTGLRNAINLLVSKQKVNYAEAYKLVHQRFNIAHIDELTPAQLPDAVTYVQQLALEGEWLAREQQPRYTLTLNQQQAMLLHTLLHSATWINHRWHQGIGNAVSALNPHLYGRTYEHVNNLHFARKQLEYELGDFQHLFSHIGKVAQPEQVLADFF